MFEVLETLMWPNKWFGGPTRRGQPADNAPCYYFRSRKEAENFVKKMNKALDKDKNS